VLLALGETGGVPCRQFHGTSCALELLVLWLLGSSRLLFS
jgi:hypothetical protein